MLALLATLLSLAAAPPFGSYWPPVGLRAMLRLEGEAEMPCVGDGPAVGTSEREGTVEEKLGARRERASDGRSRCVEGEGEGGGAGRGCGCSCD